MIFQKKSSSKKTSFLEIQCAETLAAIFRRGMLDVLGKTKKTGFGFQLLRKTDFGPDQDPDGLKVLIKIHLTELIFKKLKPVPRSPGKSQKKARSTSEK